MDLGGDAGVELTATAQACGACAVQSSSTAKFCGEFGARLARTTQSAEYKPVTVLFADVVHSMNIAAGLAVRDIFLLRLEALLARSRGDEVVYRNTRNRYCEMANALGFEGHMKYAEAMQ